MKQSKSYRFSPVTLLTLELLKSCKKFENCTETEILELAIMYLYANGSD